MKLEQSFPNNFTFINGDGTKFQFDKNEENQYYIFDRIGKGFRPCASAHKFL